MIDAFNCLPSGPPKTVASRRLITGRASGVKMSPGFAVARAFSHRVSQTRAGSGRSARASRPSAEPAACAPASGAERRTPSSRSFIVASAFASSGVNGPTTRSVAGADAGESDVAGGAGRSSRRACTRPAPGQPPRPGLRRRAVLQTYVSPRSTPAVAGLLQHRPPQRQRDDRLVSRRTADTITNCESHSILCPGSFVVCPRLHNCRTRVPDCPIRLESGTRGSTFAAPSLRRRQPSGLRSASFGGASAGCWLAQPSRSSTRNAMEPELSEAWCPSTCFLKLVRSGHHSPRSRSEVACHERGSVATESNGAEERTRTSTTLRPQAPQPSGFSGLGGARPLGEHPIAVLVHPHVVNTPHKLAGNVASVT